MTPINHSLSSILPFNQEIDREETSSHTPEEAVQAINDFPTSPPIITEMRSRASKNASTMEKPKTVIELRHRIRFTGTYNDAQSLYEPLFLLLGHFKSADFLKLTEDGGLLSNLFKYTASCSNEQQTLAMQLGDWLIDHPIQLVGPQQILSAYINALISVKNSQQQDMTLLTGTLAVQFIQEHLNQKLIHNATFYNNLYRVKKEKADKDTCRKEIKTVLKLLPQFIRKSNPETLVLEVEDCTVTDNVVDQLLKWWVEHSSTTQMQLEVQQYLGPMMYYSRAIQIADKTKIDENEVHQAASSLFKRIINNHLIESPEFKKELLSMTKNGEGDFAEFKRRLSDIENLQRFCCSEEDLKEIMEPLYDIAKEIASESRNNKFSLLIEESYLKQSWTPKREYPTQRYRNALQTYRQGFKEPLSITVRTKDVLKFQDERSKEFKEFFNFLLQDIFPIIGSPPCDYEIRAMGSYGRKEPCPFSDLETLILIEEKEDKDYFLMLLQILELQIYSLGETATIGTPVFTCLGEKHASGFHLDKPPEGWVFTPEELADLQNSSTLQEDTNSLIRTAFMSTCIQSSANLYEIYEKKISRQIREQRAQHYLNKRLEYYHAQEKQDIPFAVESEINLKTQFVEPLNYLLSDIALSLVPAENNTLKIIIALRNKGILNARSATIMKVIVKAVYSMRIQMHLEYGEQKEILHNKYKTAEVLACLNQGYYLVLNPLYHLLQNGFNYDQNIDLIEIAFDLQMHTLPNDLRELQPFIFCFAKTLVNLSCKEKEIKKYYEILTDLKDSKGLPLDQEDILRETFLESLEEASLKPAWIHKLALMPNCAGFRQVFRRKEISLKNQMELITLDHPPKSSVKLISLAFDKPRFLKQPFRILENNQIIKDPKYASSRHRICHFKGAKYDYDLHLKEVSLDPLRDYAVYNFCSRIALDLNPTSELSFFEIDDKAIPVLISETVGKPITKDTDWSKLDKAHWTWHLLCAILTRPNNRKLRHYTEENGKIYLVNSGSSFGSPVIRKNDSDALPQQASKDEFVVTFSLIPFKFFPKATPLDESVLKTFVDLDVDKILTGWILDLEKKQTSYLNLFSNNPNREDHLELHPRILFPKGALLTLYCQFHLLQNFIQNRLDDRSPIYPEDLLRQLIHLEENSNTINYVGGYVLASYELTMRENGSHTEEKLPCPTPPSLARDRYFGALPEVNGSSTYSLIEAKKELPFLYHEQTLSKEHSRYIQETKKGFIITVHFKSTPSSTSENLELIKTLTETVQPLEDRQVSSANKWCTSLTLQACSELDTTRLSPFLTEHLLYLDISECEQINNFTIQLIAENCPNLKTLILTGLKEMIEISRFDNPVKFESLKHLEISNCASLKNVWISAPGLEYVRASANPLPLSVNLETGPLVLGRFDCDSSDNVTFLHNFETVRINKGYLYGPLVKLVPGLTFSRSKENFFSLHSNTLLHHLIMETKYLDLFNLKLNDKDINKLAQLCPNLISLALDSDSLSGEGLRNLKGLKKLEALELGATCPVTLAMLEPLHAHPKLKELRLSEAHSIPADLKMLFWPKLLMAQQKTRKFYSDVGTNIGIGQRAIEHKSEHPRDKFPNPISAFAPLQRSFIASISYANHARIWNISTDEQIYLVTFNNHSTSMVALSDGRVAAENGNEITLSEVGPGYQIDSIQVEGSLKALAAFQHQPYLLGGKEGFVYIWDIRSLKEKKRFRYHRQDIRSLAICRSEKEELFAFSTGTIICVCSVKTGNIIKIFDDLSEEVLELQFFDQELIGYRTDKSFGLWDIKYHTADYIIEEQKLLAIAKHPNQPIVALRRSNGTITVYDFKNTTVLKVIDGLKHGQAVAFLADGALVAANYQNITVINNWKNKK